MGKLIVDLSKLCSLRATLTKPLQLRLIVQIIEYNEVTGHLVASNILHSQLANCENNNSIPVDSNIRSLVVVPRLPLHDSDEGKQQQQQQKKEEEYEEEVEEAEEEAPVEEPEALEGPEAGETPEAEEESEDHDKYAEEDLFQNSMVVFDSDAITTLKINLEHVLKKLSYTNNLIPGMIVNVETMFRGLGEDLIAVDLYIVKEPDLVISNMSLFSTLQDL